MPEFSIEMWQSFKQQFMSVINWLLYSFDILYDSFRSKPMLYLFVFFPIFALMFFGVFNLLTRLVPLKSLFDSSDTKNDNSMLKSSLRAGARNSGSHAVNLASAHNRQSRGAAQGLHVAPPKANPFNSPGASHAQAHGLAGFNRAGSPGASGSVRAVVAGGSSSGSVHGSGSSGSSMSYGNGLAKAAAKGVDNAVSVAKDKIKSNKVQKNNFDDFVSKNGGEYYKPPTDNVTISESTDNESISEPTDNESASDKLEYMKTHRTEPFSAVPSVKSTKPHPELDIEYDEDD